MSVNLTKPANVSSLQLTWASTVGFTVSVLARSHGEHPTWSTVLHNVPATDVLQVQATSVTALSIHVHHEDNLAASIQLDAINGKESDADTSQLTAVFIDPPLPAVALGGSVDIEGRAFEMSAEVMNMHRNVLITGDHSEFHTSQEGFHTMQMHGGVMKISYARLEFCGQRHIHGSYCLHLHLVGKCPECVFQGNAIDDSQQIGITVHGTHDALVDNNVIYNARGQGIYIQDGNEMNNTISSNVVTCESHSICNIMKKTGLYMLGMTNHILYNRISSYENTVFTQGGGKGEGLASWRVCTQNTPFGRWKGNVGHAGSRFGLYLNNQFSRNVTRDADGYITDWNSCNAHTADGRDNGLLSVIEDQFEWHQLFVGQYSLGDIQYLRYTGINNGHSMYWKASKNFADGFSAHIKDSIFAGSDGGNAVPEAANGAIQMLGPSGTFTFIMDGVQYLGGPVGCGCMCAGQHCGLSFHFHGVHSSTCQAQYLLRNVTYELSDPTGSRITQFGVSGGNPILPTFHSFDNSLLGAKSLVSGYMTGYADVPGCVKRSDTVWNGAYACQTPARRLAVRTSFDMGNLLLEGPGMAKHTRSISWPELGQNEGWMRHAFNADLYGSVVLAGGTYNLTLRQTTGVAIDFSDPVMPKYDPEHKDERIVVNINGANSCELDESQVHRCASALQNGSTALDTSARVHILGASTSYRPAEPNVTVVAVPAALDDDQPTSATAQPTPAPDATKTWEGYKEAVDGRFVSAMEMHRDGGWPDQMWVELDIGRPTTLEHITVAWGAWYPTRYTVQTANATTTADPSGQNCNYDFDGPNTNACSDARYPRCTGHVAGVAWGKCQPSDFDPSGQNCNDDFDGPNNHACNDGRYPFCTGHTPGVTWGKCQASEEPWYDVQTVVHDDPESERHACKHGFWPAGTACRSFWGHGNWECPAACTRNPAGPATIHGSDEGTGHWPYCLSTPFVTDPSGHNCARGFNATHVALQSPHQFDPSNQNCNDDFDGPNNHACNDARYPLCIGHVANVAWGKCQVSDYVAPEDNACPDAQYPICQGYESGVAAWLKLDLGAQHAVSAVKIWNRADCCQQRLGPT